jgi:hypothetical protein
MKTFIKNFKRFLVGLLIIALTVAILFTLAFIADAYPFVLIGITIAILAWSIGAIIV